MNSKARLMRSQAFRSIEDSIQREVESPVARLEAGARESEERVRPLAPRATAEADRVVRAVEAALRPDGCIGLACAKEERRLAEVRARLHREGVLPAQARVGEALQQLEGARRVVQAATVAVAKFGVDTDRDVAGLGAAEPLMEQAVETVRSASQALDADLQALRALVRAVRDLTASVGSAV